MAKRVRKVPRYIREGRAGTVPDGDGLPPGMPPGAIPADQSAFAPHNSYSPPLWYEDHEFQCADCGSDEVWTAERQKWWYEVAKGSIYAGATRCRACRAARREQHRGTPLRSHRERIIAAEAVPPEAPPERTDS